MVSDHKESSEIDPINSCISTMTEHIAEKVVTSPNKTLLLKSEIIHMQVVFLEDKIYRNNAI
jgi:hypothetical protein